MTFRGALEKKGCHFERKCKACPGAISASEENLFAFQLFCHTLPSPSFIPISESYATESRGKWCEVVFEMASQKSFIWWTPLLELLNILLLLLLAFHTSRNKNLFFIFLRVFLSPESLGLKLSQMSAIKLENGHSSFSRRSKMAIPLVARTYLPYLQLSWLNHRPKWRGTELYTFLEPCSMFHIWGPSKEYKSKYAFYFMFPLLLHTRTKWASHAFIFTV